MSKIINVGKVVPQKGIDYFDGIDGTNGKSLEFNWNNTQLGVRQEGQQEYQYQDLQGATGPAGRDGTDGRDGAIQYTAGDNITIENNVISASVPSVSKTIYDWQRESESGSLSTNEKTRLSEIINEAVATGTAIINMILPGGTSYLLTMSKKITSLGSGTNTYNFIGGSMMSGTSDYRANYYVLQLNASWSDGIATVTWGYCYPYIQQQWARLGASNSFSNSNSFTQLPTCSAVPTEDNQLVNKKYVDDNAGGGGSVPVYFIQNNNNNNGNLLNYGGLAGKTAEFTEILNDVASNGYDAFIVNCYSSNRNVPNAMSGIVYQSYKVNLVQGNGSFMISGLFFITPYMGATAGIPFLVVNTATINYSYSNGVYTCTSINQDNVQYRVATRAYVDSKLTTYTGYDASKTQVLKNVNGSIQWIDE